MKEFRKNIQGYFICEECRIFTKRRCGLSKHINVFHNGVKVYFDKWIKDNDEDKCNICKKETTYRNFKSGYKQTCCKKCENKYKHNKSKEACLKKYGVEYPLQNKNINNKQKQTMNNNWGVNNPGQSSILNIKKKNTFIKKYNCENPLQIKQIFEKTQKSSYKLKKFRDTSIYYRGTYELDFLEKFYNIYPDIQNGPTIKYIFRGIKKIYYPDFYIPSLNLIIECKNSYLIKKDIEKIKAKENAVLLNGFDYYIIIDKNYENLF